MAQQAGLVELVSSSFRALTQGQLPSVDIMKLLISKALGYGIILGATLVKVPQILNVVKAESAEGLSPFSIELETLSLMIHASYGYLRQMPFSAYGEAIMLVIQNIALVGLVYRYQKQPLVRSMVLWSVISLVVITVRRGLLTQDQVTTVYEANTALMLAARVPQILSNLRAKSTGQLSIITYAMNQAGSLARIYTSLQEGGGSAMVRSYMLSFFLNSVIVAQILLYGKMRPSPTMAKAKAARAKAVKQS